MDEAPPAAVRIALLAQGHERGEFRALLESEGFEVVVDEGFDTPLPENWNGAEVLLVGMGDQPDRSQVEGVLQRSPLPVLLNKGGVESSEVWHRRFIAKLQVLASRAEPSAQQIRPDLRVVEGRGKVAAQPPRLIVLGASIGGPKAVARFLQALPDDLPVTLLLAQHISESFQGLLAEQLDRCSRWPVAVLGESQIVEAGQVWVVPAENRIEIKPDGPIRCSGQTWKSAHRPDIDAVLRSAAESYGVHCGAIMFSGLGKDGTQGCESVLRHGGFVWAQSSESCVISNMPEAARRSCEVELSGSPEELARALTTRCQLESVSIN